MDLRDLSNVNKRKIKRRPPIETIFLKKKVFFSKKRRRLCVEYTHTDFKLNLLDSLYKEIRSFAYHKQYVVYNSELNLFESKWTEIWPSKSLRYFSEYIYSYFSFKKINFIKSFCFNLIRSCKSKYFIRLNFFHLLKVSPWPLFASFSLFSFMLLTTGYLHYHVSFWYVIISLSLIIMSFYFWLRDVIRELVFLKKYTTLIKYNLRTGFWLFIVSELMFFIGFFWAFFHFSWEPDIQLATVWPPFNGIQLNNLYIPTINTFFLLLSGIALNWVQYSILGGSYSNAIFGFICLFIYALYFIYSQYSEYVFAFQQLNDSVFGSSMYMLTSFHGLHVIVGLIMLIVCCVRFYLGHFTATNYLGLVLSGWYWHFVDIIWIFVYVFVYLWGTWVPANIVDILVYNFFK